MQFDLWMIEIDLEDQPLQYGLCILDPDEYEFFEKGIPGEALAGTFTDFTKDDLPDHTTFHPNEVFFEFLHQVLDEEGRKAAEFKKEAKRQHDGWVYLIDGRTRSPEGEVPPEDIIGAFKVTNGEMGEYEPSQKHRLLTERGLFQLPPKIQKKFLTRVIKKAKARKS